MHPLFFGVKRVHWLLVGIQKFWLEEECETDVTPARYDLLRVIDAYGGSCARWRVVKVLGVSGPVVSRMVKALEELGLVKRKREPHDRRYVCIELTAKGREEVHFGRHFTEGEDLDRIARSYFSTVTSETGRLRQSSGFAELLLSARVELADPAPLVHPWAADRLYDEYGYFKLQRRAGPLALAC
jgi:DNA-binding MarR family transcriptional regulator